MFSEKEIAYLKSQRLARIATVSKDLQPDVAPVGFEFDGSYFYIGGLDIKRTLKYKNTLSNPRATLVVDDLESTDPWMPRGIKVRGLTEIVESLRAANKRQADRQCLSGERRGVAVEAVREEDHR